MIGLLVEVGVGLGLFTAEYVYHRWFEDKPVVKPQPQEVSIPRVDEGAPIPIIYGQCRVRAPILAWAGTPINDGFYRMNMLFVVGITMADGRGSTSRLHGMWAGDQKASWPNPADPETTLFVSGPGPIGPLATYYDGNPAQDPGAGQLGTTQVAEGVDIFSIPSYYGYLSILLWSSGGVPWNFGTSPGVGAYSFEASSYYQIGDYPAPGVYSQIGLDCNPANALWDLLSATLGKLGISTSYLDKPSFQAAAFKLYAEGNGFSRSFEGSQKADEIIQSILRQIDGAIDEDPVTGKLVLTLVRPVDPATLLHITRDNCDKLTGFSMGGWTGLPSSLRFIWTNRGKDYNDDTIVIHNQGNAVTQGEREEVAVEMRGVCESSNAITLADRESQALFRPIIKCRVFVGREFMRLVRGNAVKLTWSGPDISGVVMRVADVNRGTIEDGKIALDLISDYFYSARGSVQVPPIEHADKLKNAIDEAITF
jgi:hypothetical protein